MAVSSRSRRTTACKVALRVIVVNCLDSFSGAEALASYIRVLREGGTVSQQVTRLEPIRRRDRKTLVCSWLGS